MVKQFWWDKCIANVNGSVAREKYLGRLQKRRSDAKPSYEYPKSVDACDDGNVMSVS